MNCDDLVWCPVCSGQGYLTVRTPRKVTTRCGNCLGTAWVRDSDTRRRAETTEIGSVRSTGSAGPQDIAQ